MSDYRENTDDLFKDQESNVVDDQTKSQNVEDEPQQEEQFTPTSPDLSENEMDEDLVTAVLLVKNKSGAVLPITNLENLKIERQANAHEVLRMCADVQDQISAIRIVGELAQIFSHVNKASINGIAELMSIKLNGGDDA
jgi:hypothetical protein